MREDIRYGVIFVSAGLIVLSVMVASIAGAADLPRPVSTVERTKACGLLEIVTFAREIGQEAIFSDNLRPLAKRLEEIARNDEQRCWELVAEVSREYNDLFSHMNGEIDRKDKQCTATINALTRAPKR